MFWKKVTLAGYAAVHCGYPYFSWQHDLHQAIL